MGNFVTDTKRVNDILIGHEWEYGLCREPGGETSRVRFDATYESNRWVPSPGWITKHEETGYELNYKGGQPFGEAPERFDELDRWFTDMADRGIYIGVLHNVRNGPNCGNHVHINCYPGAGPAVSGPHLLDTYMEKYQAMFWDLCDIPDTRFKKRVNYNYPKHPQVRWSMYVDTYGLIHPEGRAEELFPDDMQWCGRCHTASRSCIGTKNHASPYWRAATRLEISVARQRFLRSGDVDGVYARSRPGGPVTYDGRLGTVSDLHPRLYPRAGKGEDFSVRWNIRNPNALGGSQGTAELRMWNSSMNRQTNAERHDLMRGLLMDTIQATKKVRLVTINFDDPPSKSQRLRDDRGRFMSAAESATH